MHSPLQSSAQRLIEYYGLILPDGLHTACEALKGLSDEDCIDVLLLELQVQNIYVGHDFMKKSQEKIEVLIL